MFESFEKMGVEVEL